MSVNFDRLQQYLMMQFIKGFVSAYLALASVVLLFDTVELLRRAASRDFVPASTVFGMGLLKLPQMMELLIPFVFLFGAMFVFWRLNRSHELVVIRTSGISVWQFLKPGLIIAGVWGLLQITLLNPFSAALYNKFSQLDTKYSKKHVSILYFHRWSVVAPSRWHHHHDSARRNCRAGFRIARRKRVPVRPGF